MALAHGHHRAEEDRQDAEDQRHGLGPGSLKRRAEDVIDHAQHRVNARVDHRHRVQQGRDRGGCGAGSGQPGAQRKHRRLHAEAEEARQKRRAHEILRHAGKIQPAQLEVAACVLGDHDQRGEGKGGAADGIADVGARRTNGGRILLVPHQRQRDQGDALEEHVEREHVARAAVEDHHAEGHGVEGEEAVLALLVLHVFRGVQRSQRPEEGHQAQEHPAHAVQAEAQAVRAGEGDERDLLRAAQNQPQHH